MGKTIDLSLFEKELIVGGRLVGVSISKTTNLIVFSKAAISKVFKSRNLDPKSFSRRPNWDSSTVFQEIETASSRAATNTNRQPRLFLTDFSSNYA
ncbi:hypothetical protein TNCV_1060841 [Trichonephila clavipes]|nr:hypothetical protein TNCV_1060841 [Trichonephila clavipes]